MAVYGGYTPNNGRETARPLTTVFTQLQKSSGCQRANNRLQVPSTNVAATRGREVAGDFPVRIAAPGIHIFGPHRERFWMGNYLPLKKHFVRLLEEIVDESTITYANALRFVEMIDFDRQTFDQLPDTEAPYWLVNMPVVELAAPANGLLVYSPIPLDAQGYLKAALDNLGTVRIVIAPHSFHTAGLTTFRDAYPDALFVCQKGGMLTGGKSLLDVKPELEFHSAIENEASIRENPVLSDLILNDFAVEIMNDGALNELVLHHKASNTLINADFVYKAAEFASVPGLGGPEQCYIGPDWFAAAYQTLNLDPSPSELLPDNRALLAKHPKFDRVGFLNSLERVLTWTIDCMICTHTDPIAGAGGREAILKSWQWFREED